MDPAIFKQNIKIDDAKFRDTANKAGIIEICFLKMGDAFQHQVAYFHKNKKTDGYADKKNDQQRA